MAILTCNLDARPYTGIRNVVGKLRIKTAKYITPYFDGTPNYEQIQGVQQGKVYDVVQVEGYGDAEDVTIINDNGEKQVLADFFFEEI